MCLFSLEADQTRKASVGDQLVVHGFSHAVGLTEAFHPGRLACCMTTGMAAHFAVVPLMLQDHFHIPAQATALFEEGGAGDNHEDCFVFMSAEGHEVRIPLEEMELGTQTTIVPAMDEVDRAANATIDRIAAKIATGGGRDTEDTGHELVTAGSGRGNAARSAALVTIFMIIILA
jgi:hypothetical protein